MPKSGDKRQVETEESWITGSLNFVVFLAIAAVAYTDFIVVPNISLGYLYMLPIALSALINPLALTIALAVGRKTVRLWRERFRTLGLRALGDCSRPGAGKATYDSLRIKTVIDATLQSKPEGPLIGAVARWQ